MQKLKPRAISYDRFLFILSTINPSISIDIDIGVQPKPNPKIVASIGCSTYVIRPYVILFTENHSVIADVKASLQHISKYSIHNI